MDKPVYVGRYRVIEELGRGGMGVVYRGEDPVLERPVAIKVLPPKRLTPKMVERFLREAKTAARLDSPYIVKIHDIGQVDDIYFIVMELVEGQALSDMIEEDVVPNPEKLSQLLAIYRQVLEAVGYAHENQVIHRDLKPDNIMVNKSGHVKVMDFGLAFFQGQHSLTEVGQVMGTAAYVSPEQAQGQVTDQRTDIYSLGVILFEIITGTWPFTASNPLEMFRKVAEVAPPSPRGINKSISVNLENIVLRMLAKKPEDRFQSISDILAIYDAAVSANSAMISKPSLPLFGSAETKPASNVEFDAQALLDSIAGGDLTTDWFKDLDLGDNVLSNMPTSAPASEPGPMTFARPVPPAPGPSLRQNISQTVVDAEPKHNLPMGAFTPPMSPLAVNSTTAMVSPAVAPPPLAAESAHASSSAEPASASVVAESAQPSGSLAQAVSPAQYKGVTSNSPGAGSSAAKGGYKPFVKRNSGNAVASNDWLSNVNESNKGRVEDLLGRLQQQENEASTPLEDSERSVFCPKCGVENNFQNKVCEKCGCTLSISEYVTQREAANFLQDGKEHYEKANYREAIVELLQAISKDSNSSEAYLYLGRSYLELGEYGPAHNALERAVNLSTNAAPYIAMADFYQATEQPDMVISSLLHALDREEYDTATRCRLAFVYHEAGRINAAIEQYRLAVEYDPNCLEANRQLGFILADEEQYESAIAYLEQACYLDPNDSNTYGLLSRLHLKVGQVKQAQQVLRTAIQHNENNANLHSELATLYLAQDQSNLAAQELNTSLELDPGNSEASVRLATLLYQNGQVGEAVQQLEQSLTHHPNDLQVHRQLGEIYIRAGHLEQALDHFEKLVELDPQSAESYSRLGSIYQKKNYSQESLNAYQKAVELHPVNSAYREDLAMAYYTKGQLGAAAQEFAKAARLDYTNPEYPKAMGIIMVDMGQYEEAVRQLKHSLELNANDPQAHGMLGKAFVGQGLNNMAISEFQRALDLNPQWYFLNLPLARAYAQQGRYEQAIGCFQAFLRQADNSSDNRLFCQTCVDMGYSYFNNRDYTQAETVFKAVLQRNCTDAGAWRGMAKVALAKKRYDKAQQYLNKGLQYEPRNLELQMLAADIQGGRGSWGNAVSIMQTAVEQHPEAPEAIEHLGRALRKCGRLQDAIDIFDEGGRRFPNMAGHFQWLRGRIEYRQGLYDQALWSYRQALSEICDDWRIYVDLGKTCVSLQQMSDARDAFQHAYKCAPKDEKEKIKQLMDRLSYG